MKHIGEYLDEAMRELLEERAAIREFDGNQSREEAESGAVAEYLEIVESKRGHLAANRLRDDCREAWKAKKEIAA
jgi:hypothetical protein